MAFPLRGLEKTGFVALGLRPRGRVPLYQLLSWTLTVTGMGDVADEGRRLEGVQ